MTRTLCALVVCVLTAGCGGATSPSGGGAKTNGGASSRVTGNLQQAVTVCRKEIAASPDIPAAAKSAAESACAGIRTGNVSGLRAIALRACRRAVAKLPNAEQAAAPAECRKR